MYTLLYLKWITNKELLCSAWDSAQCYVAACMGGEFGGEWIHVYVWLSPFSFHLKLSQPCQSALLQYKIALKKNKKDLKSMTHSFSFKCLRKRLLPQWSVFQILSDTMHINVQLLYPG